jgi:hypothetical protein
VTRYKSDTRSQNTPSPHTPYGASGLQAVSVNRQLGRGHVALQYVEGDGYSGRHSSRRHRGRNAQSYDRFGFDRYGLNDDGVAAHALGVRL